ncbi:MAG: class I SAM-dependent RNA methyltransferase, partial [Clostridiales bacterium]|nr:class I SAM-dependent RNA methyltransferase [Clostridiales bacterium]
KAICERLKAKHNVLSLSEDGEEYSVEAAAFMDNFEISLDTSGEGLHKRGYRSMVWTAPLRETLAAAILMLSVWKKDRALIDPFTGSGTIPIEAALIATNTAPGLYRSFAFEKFKYAPGVIERVREEAKDKEDLNLSARISGFDINPKAIKLAVKHAEAAGMKKFIHFQTADMRTISSRYSHGVMVANPPYGERLMDEENLKALYRDFGKVYRSLDEWSCYAITSYRGFEKHFGQKADKVRKLYNSEIECSLYQFLGAPPKRNNNESAGSKG